MRFLWQQNEVKCDEMILHDDCIDVDICHRPADPLVNKFRLSQNQRRLNVKTARTNERGRGQQF